MFSWLDRNAAAVQALASIATVLITCALAWITRKYVLLTQELAVTAREQLRFQQHSERSDVAQLLTLIEMCLGNLSRVPTREQDADRLRDVSLWRHSDESRFASLSASVLGSSPMIHQAVQALNGVRAKIDGLRQLPADQAVGPSFSWTQWSREVINARTALRAVRDAAEAAETSLAERIENGDVPAGTAAPSLRLATKRAEPNPP